MKIYLAIFLTIYYDYDFLMPLGPANIFWAPILLVVRYVWKILTVHKWSHLCQIKLLEQTDEGLMVAYES